MSKKIISFTLLSASLLFHSTMLEAMMRLRCLLKTPRALGKAVLRPIKSPASVGLLNHFPLKNQQNRNFSSKSLPGNNNSLLIESIQDGSKEKLYELIKKGLVDINARYDNNDTILHIAAKSDLSPEIIEVLIKAGADLNAQNDLGYTPLHLAVKYERAEMVKLLVANGANPNATHTKGIWGKIVPGSLFRLFAQGKSPLYFAQEKDNPSSETLEIIKFLEPLTHKSLWFVVTPEVALRRAILLNRLEKIKLLLSEQVFSKQALDAALLEGASHYETTAEVLALIIDAGADVNTKNSLQRTPLHYAAPYGNVATVKLLLKKGANPSISDRNGETPLDLAKKRLFPSKEIIEILEQCTVKPKKNSW